MEFKIIAGPGRSGKTTCLRNQIIETTMQEPEQRIIYIVPEQATLMAQRDLLEMHPRGGILQVEILSFNRLAYRILQETGADTCQTLDDMGKSMLLYKTALDHKDELLYYGSEIRHRGFIGQLKIMLTEMFQYRIDAKVLEEISGSLDPEGTLYRKLHDIRVLYTAFCEKTSAETIPSERLLDLLAEQIPRSELLDGADIYLDDFFGFTPQQYEVLARLFEKARRVCMTLPCTRKDWEVPAPQPGAMYYQSQKILKHLRDMGIHGKVRWMDQAYGAEELQYLTTYLWPETALQDPQRQAERVHVYKAERPDQEIEWILSQIETDVRKRGYAYGDIAILLGSGDYTPLLERLADRYQIPVFLDRRVEMQDHPAVRLIEDMLQMLVRGFSYDTVFAWAKSGFLPYEREAIDTMENQALSRGWRGLRIYKEAFLGISGDLQTRTLTEHLFELLQKLSAAEGTILFYTQTLEQVLETLRLKEQLQTQAEAFAESGQRIRQSIHEQVYERICSVLEQLDAVLGQERTDLAGFCEILTTGFGQSKLGLVPPTPDQVQVADPERSRISHARSLYVAGFQDEYFPSVPEDPGLLTDHERRSLATFHDLAADRGLKTGDQAFHLYNILGKAEEKISFTYATADSKGQGRRPSSYVQRLEMLFTKESLYTKGWPRAMHPNWLIDQLAKGRYPEEVQQTVIRWLAQHDQGPILDVIAAGTKDHAPQETLEDDLLWELLGLSTRSVSVSQLEQYARCPLAYFFNYGLALKEREVLSIRPLDDGNVLHALLEKIGPQLEGQGTIGTEKIDAVMQTLLDEQSEAFARYQTSSRYQYYWNKLRSTAERAIMILRRQIQSGAFHPEAFEWTFGGPEGSGSALPIRLKDGRVVHLMGKIDRIDVLREDGQEYVRILDYKSGSTGWDPWEIYEGLRLQLPIYLDAVQAATDARPAGIFYFHLSPKTQKGNYEASEIEQLKEVLTSARLDGIVLNDLHIIEMMDQEIQGKSMIIPVTLKKDGSPDARSRVVQEEQFEELRRFARAKAASLADRIAEGDIDANPIASAGYTEPACAQCAFRGACRLDIDREQDRFHAKGNHTKEDFWKKIREEEP
ncbi:MAG: PD-(D/E)XK nuclease family protein [Clostridiales bacterium]|nr:PD-(D/E)XK nuclease family protein [Clostridiales bacterium]